MQFLNIISEQLLGEGIIITPLTKATAVSGGCINDCFKIENQHQSFFVKINSNKAYPNMFAAEVKGLDLLRESQTIHIPKVIKHFDINQNSFLVLEWVEKDAVTKEYWSDFGNQLAGLHQISSDDFGLQHDNYIGSLRQLNSFRKDWHVFFLENRLIPQLELGIQNGWTSGSIFKHAEQMAKVVEDEFPKEPPALLHGDLWSGNYLIGPKGNVYLIDPAVYFGHREMEIAFTKMFGGFSSEFYEAYHEKFPLSADFHKRISIHQLYPNLVHANLFGGHYIAECVEILRKY
ncbi:MAG: fructosamine kinase family protein [Bacteroidetes bacterium]|nr:fructosamine kinase family protein [Bacteroidota bacterium]